MKKLALFFAVLHSFIATSQELSYWSELSKSFAKLQGDHKQVISLYESNAESLPEPGPNNVDYFSCIKQVYMAYLQTGKRKKAMEYAQLMGQYQSQNYGYSDPSMNRSQGTNDNYIKQRLDIKKSDEADAQMEAQMQMQAAYMQNLANMSDLNEEERQQLDAMSDMMSNYSSDNLGSQLQQIMQMSGASEEEQAKLIAQISAVQQQFQGTSIDTEGQTLEEQYNALNQVLADNKAQTDEALNRQNERLKMVNLQQNFLSLNNYFESTDWMTQEHIDALGSIPERNYEADLDLEDAIMLFKEEYETGVDFSSREEQQLSNSLQILKGYFDEELERSLGENKALLEQFGGSDALEISYGSVIQTAAELNKRRDESIAMIEIILDVYSDMGKLIGINNLSGLTFDSEQVRQIAKNRQANLNVVLQLEEKYGQPGGTFKFDMFEDPAEGFEEYTFNSIIASKEVDFKTQQFIRQGVQRSNDITLKQLYDRSVDLRTRMSLIHQLPNDEQTELGWTTETFKDSISQVRSWDKDIYFKITQKSPSGQLESMYSLSWQEIQRKLKANEAFIDIERIEDINDFKNVTYLITVVKSNGRPKSVTIGGDGGLALENEYKVINHKLLSSNSGSITPTTKYNDTQPYTVFWEPIATMIDGAERIMVSTDGIYSQLSLDALINPNTNRYLIEEIEIVRLASIGGMMSEDNTTKAGVKNVSLFGNPNYDHDRSSSSTKTRQMLFTGQPLVALPGTQEEVQIIEETFQQNGWNTSSFMQSEATEDNFKSMSSAAIVHIATHGSFTPPPSRNQTLNPINQKFLENPFLRSRLYFTGANATLEGKYYDNNDGILTAQEILYKDFSSTDLVVLSACETGLGDKIDGEGVFGLPRAFHLAGVDNVIMSLWPVNDEATKELMIKFYSNYLDQKLDARTALRMAKLEMMKEYQHPNYWASFVLSQ